MTQDIGPDDDVAQGEEEPVDEKETTDWRSRVRASIALVILILILLLFFCQYLGGGNRPSGTGSPGTATNAPLPSIVDEDEPEIAREIDEGPVVPDVIGMTRSEAFSAIEAAGYHASATEVYGTTKPANTVFEQHPSGGTVLDEGGTVGMLIQARSKPTVTVPDLHGLKQAEAERRIRALGLDVVLSYAPPTGSRQVGRTYSQWPRAGKQVVVGGEVQIEITIRP